MPDETTNPVIQTLIDFVEESPNMFTSYRGKSYSFADPELPEAATKEVIRNLTTRLKAL